MACCWSVNFTVSFILGVRCATVIPFAPYGSAVIAWTQKTLHPPVKCHETVIDNLSSGNIPCLSLHRQECALRNGKRTALLVKRTTVRLGIRSGLFHADYIDSGHSDAAALLSNRGYSRSTACRNNRIVGLIAFERYDASGNLNAF